MKTIKAGIVGGSGYTGGELIRLLLQHPAVKIDFVNSRSHIGKPISDIHTDLLGDTDLVFSEVNHSADVYFLCLPHGQSGQWLADNKLPQDKVIIDLSNEFRLSTKNSSHHFIYGLPELYRNEIVKSKRIANPGCFATAIQLGLMPLVKRNIADTFHTTAITGSTGAGVSLSNSVSFSWRNNNVSAYKTLKHQHLAEMKQHGLHNDKTEATIHFVPWRGNFTRGIFASTTLQTNMELDKLHDLYEDFYSTSRFVNISKSPIDLKQVVNTNKCVIQLEKEGDTLVVHAAIDNLIKGASGQAIQNMNLIFGFDEATGLVLKPTAY